MLLAPLLPDWADVLWRMSVERYHSLIDAGAFDDNDRVELLEGVVFEKAPKNPDHRIATRQTCDALRDAIPAGWYVDEQSPVTTSTSEPEPDASIVRGRTADYRDRNPGPQDVALVVEVADSSLSRDRGLKLRIYARAGIAVYWILNLQTRALEIYTNPQGDEYSMRVTLREAETAPLQIGDATVHVRVAQLLPPAR